MAELTFGDAAPGRDFKGGGDVTGDEAEEIAGLEGAKSEFELDEDFAAAHVACVPFDGECWSVGCCGVLGRVLHG